MNRVDRKHDLLMERMRLDKFFTLFLDKFHEKMDPDKTDTPVWKLYKSKLKEYESIQQELKSLDYWINKGHYVQIS